MVEIDDSEGLDAAKGDTAVVTSTGMDDAVGARQD